MDCCDIVCCWEWISTCGLLGSEWDGLLGGKLLWIRLANSLIGRESEFAVGESIRLSCGFQFASEAISVVSSANSAYLRAAFSSNRSK